MWTHEVRRHGVNSEFDEAKDRLDNLAVGGGQKDEKGGEDL